MPRALDSARLARPTPPRVRAGSTQWSRSRGVDTRLVRRDNPLMTSITTARLLLRPFADRDFDAFAALNADARVREFFPTVLDRAESDASAEQYRNHWAHHGFGRWAVEVPNIAEFVGVVGLTHVPFTAPFTPAVEIGWRVAYDHWGHGYASEAARAVCQFGFKMLGLPEIVSFTAPTNVRSRHVMTRIGMTYSATDDFEHPMLPVGHPLRHHVLYRLVRPSP
jgi:RimJ/RimL family protein N-acetyltransferase